MLTEFPGLAITLSMERPSRPTLRPCFMGQFENHRNPVTDSLAKVVTITHVRPLAKLRSRVRETRPAPGASSRKLIGVGGITEQAEHALFAVMGHRWMSEVFAIHGRVISKLEVAGRQHTHWSGIARLKLSAMEWVIADEPTESAGPTLGRLSRALTVWMMAAIG